MTELTEQPSRNQQPNPRGGLAVKVIETRPVDAAVWCLLQAADNSWELWMPDANIEALVQVGTLHVLP